MRLAVIVRKKIVARFVVLFRNSVPATGPQANQQINGSVPMRSGNSCIPRSASKNAPLNIAEDQNAFGFFRAAKKRQTDSTAAISGKPLPLYRWTRAHLRIAGEAAADIESCTVLKMPLKTGRPIGFRDQNLSAPVQEQGFFSGGTEVCPRATLSRPLLRSHHRPTLPQSQKYP